MGKKNRDDFFSTEKEYNMQNTANDYTDGDLSNVDYNKYLNDYDDGEDIVKKSDDNQDLFEDIKSKKEGPSIKEKQKKDKEKKHKKIVIVLVCVLLAIILAFGGVVAYLFYVTGGAKYGDNGVEYNENAVIEDENLDFEAMSDVTDASSLNGFLRGWLTNNGEKMYSKNVLNILLCGVDSEDGTASNGRADAIMLVSIDQKNKKITLSSFFRDSYTYMEIPDKQGKIKERYEKLNAAYIFGGPAALIDTIERNYKIEIDQYIAVDFESFTDLIDALGGVTVDVTDKEAKYLRRTTRYENFPSGKNCKIDGAQALVYSRIRKLDSDVNRTERQRKVIKSLIDSAKSASTGQLVNAYKQTAKYIRTGYTQGEVISLIATAVTQNWMDYEMNEITLPSNEGVDTVSAYLYTTSMPKTPQWVWIVDYPVCAQKLQLAIYGESNIIHEAGRTSVLDFTKTKPSSNSTSTDKTTPDKTEPSSKVDYTEPTDVDLTQENDNPTDVTPTEPMEPTNPTEPTQAPEENPGEAEENGED